MCSVKFLVLPLSNWVHGNTQFLHKFFLAYIWFNYHLLKVCCGWTNFPHKFLQIRWLFWRYVLFKIESTPLQPKFHQNLNFKAEKISTPTLKKVVFGYLAPGLQKLFLQKNLKVQRFWGTLSNFNFISLHLELQYT